ncbi:MULTISPECIES: ABC transporter permease [unclassified Bacillus (in: firmicutes)]|uniref:ABC transporter permease n=1 Tax=unclassified Bacillus (in: firmicutes) TaxID=185979 RepID=UPI0008E30A1E|nr:MULTISPECIES: ABC transporter permease [unclassified Bacillus (in: firmicutes)]SFA88025.1 ABC-2 type transport system permease protein [Bacillus sp. UNCCL13]SFQ84492.1 ABC-2 type transport system permease protein [Bacillus sp. cl95]
MKAYWHLTLAQLRIFWRNKQVLFWTLFFPIVLMLTLGSFLGNGNNVSLAIGVLDKDQTVQSKELIQSFKKAGDIEVEKYNTKDKAIEAVKSGDIQLVLEIPKGYAEHLNNDPSAEPMNVPVYFNETNMAASQLAITVVSQVIDGVSKATLQYEPLLKVESIGVQAVNLRYIDFLVPGMVALSIMSNNMNGVAGQISSWRERGILRRMQGTRLKASTFIAAQITARLVLNGSQALLLLLIANLVFDLTIKGSWLVVISLVVLGTLAFMAIGFIIAGLAKTPESVGPIAGFLTFPMMFLGGVFFPIKNMPDLIQPFVNLLPISHLSHALRETMNLGTPFMSLLPEFSILTGWLIVAFITASYVFKWD